MAQGISDEADSGQLPRDVAKQVEEHRRRGGVQHLVQMLRDIAVGAPPVPCRPPSRRMPPSEWVRHRPVAIVQVTSEMSIKMAAGLESLTHDILVISCNTASVISSIRCNSAV